MSEREERNARALVEIAKLVGLHYEVDQAELVGRVKYELQTAEQDRARLKATVERVEAVHRLMLTSSEFAMVNMAGKLRSALDDPTPPKGGSK